MKISDLKIGNIYFMCALDLTDTDAQIPKIETLVYYGIHEDPKYKNEYIFVNPKWYYSNENKNDTYKHEKSNYISISSYEIEPLISDIEDLHEFVNYLTSEEYAQPILGT